MALQKQPMLVLVIAVGRDMADGEAIKAKMATYPTPWNAD